MTTQQRFCTALIPLLMAASTACVQTRATHLPDPPADASDELVQAHAAADSAFAQCAEVHNAARFPWQLPVAAGLAAAAVTALVAVAVGPFATSLWVTPNAQPYVNAAGVGGFALVAVASAAVSAVFGAAVPGALDTARVRGKTLKVAEARAAEALSAGDERALHALARSLYEDCRVVAGARERSASVAIIKDYDRYRRELRERDDDAFALDKERADLNAITQKQQGLLDEKNSAEAIAKAKAAADAARIAALQDDLSERTAEVGSLQGEVERLENERAQLSTSQQKLLEEKRKLAEKSSKYAEVAEALRAEVTAGALQVRRLQNGVVVELQNQVLFPSGSAELNEGGQETLRSVATAIQGLRDQRVRIEGHTDNVPTGKNSEYPSNWELSAARAIAVTKFLQEAGVNPSIMSAEGRSQYAPISSNRSTRGRSKNRRIEIYLVPRAKGSKASWRPEDADKPQ